MAELANQIPSYKWGKPISQKVVVRCPHILIWNDQSGHTFESLQYHRGKSQEISLSAVCPRVEMIFTRSATKHRFSVPSNLSTTMCGRSYYDDTCRRNNECMNNCTVKSNPLYSTSTSFTPVHAISEVTRSTRSGRACCSRSIDF